jgi:hypothetical protein
MAGRVGSALAVIAVLVALAAAVVAVVRLRARRGIATAMQRATYDVLHTAALAAEPLRGGLTAASAGKAIRHLRALVGAVGMTIDDGHKSLAFDGHGRVMQPLAVSGQGDGMVAVLADIEPEKHLVVAVHRIASPRQQPAMQVSVGSDVDQRDSDAISADGGDRSAQRTMKVNTGVLAHLSGDANSQRSASGRRTPAWLGRWPPSPSTSRKS